MEPKRTVTQPLDMDCESALAFVNLLFDKHGKDFPQVLELTKEMYSDVHDFFQENGLGVVLDILLDFTRSAIRAYDTSDMTAEDLVDVYEQYAEVGLLLTSLMHSLHHRMLVVDKLQESYYLMRIRKEREKYAEEE